MSVINALYLNQGQSTIAENPSIVYSAEELYDKYSPYLYSTITNIILNRQLADEIMFKLFIYIDKNLWDFNPRNSSFQIWLINKARNIAIDNLCSSQNAYHGNKIFKILSSAEKTVFALFYFRRYSLMQIVDLLNLRLVVVEKLLQCAEAKVEELDNLIDKL